MNRDGGLRAIYRKHLPRVHWVSIESPMTHSGIPDTNYCFGGVEGWIENKLVRRSDRVEMQKGQPAWMERRHRAGGRVFIAVRWPKNDDTLYLLAPQAGRLLLQGTGLVTLPAELSWGCWHGGPARWDWPRIAKIIGLP